jgi:hypothetical protein
MITKYVESIVDDLHAGAFGPTYGITADLDRLAHGGTNDVILFDVYPHKKLADANAALENPDDHPVTQLIKRNVADSNLPVKLDVRREGDTIRVTFVRPE